MIYFVLAMCLFRSAAYEEVLRLLSEGLRRDGWDVPCTAAISRARVRLGPEPLRGAVTLSVAVWDDLRVGSCGRGRRRTRATAIR